MNSFKNLLDELAPLAKAMDTTGDKGGEAAAGDAAAGATGADDGKIKAAAADGEAQSPGSEGGADGDPLTKAFEIQMPDGSTQTAVDGTELLKALGAKLDATTGHIGDVLTAVTAALKSQGEQQAASNALIKSLQEEVGTLRAGGSGRRTMLSIHDKTPAGAGGDLRKSGESEGIPAEEFMAKCMDAQKAGKITGLQVTIAESSINRGLQVPPEIVQAVVG